MNSIGFKDFPALEYATQEAFNTLCVNLSFSGSDVRKILITSCNPGEGKSFVCMNILRTMAGLGQKVVLVDMDLRRSRITEDYGVFYPEGGKNHKGVSHLLAGKCELENALYETDIPGAFLLPVGRTVANSLTLCRSAAVKQLLDSLAEDFDYVIVDAPPIGSTIDAAELAKNCDGAVMVAYYGEISRREFAEAKHQLEQSGCRMLGGVINGAEVDSYLNRKYYYKKYYYRHYEDYYSKDAEDKPKKKKAVKSAPAAQTHKAPAPQKADTADRKDL